MKKKGATREPPKPMLVGSSRTPQLIMLVFMGVSERDAIIAHMMSASVALVLKHAECKSKCLVSVVH